MSLEFLPRKLQQRPAKPQQSEAVRDGSERSNYNQKVDRIDKGKQKARSTEISDETVLTTLKLAFSNYTLQTDEAVRGLISSAGDNECIFGICVIQTYLNAC